MQNCDVVIPYPEIKSPFLLVDSDEPEPSAPKWKDAEVPHLNAVRSAVRADLESLRERREDLRQLLEINTRKFAALSVEISTLTHVREVLDSAFGEGGAQ